MVHSRSVVEHGIDGETGELIRARLSPEPWGVVRELPVPIA